MSCVPAFSKQVRTASRLRDRPVKAITLSRGEARAMQKAGSVLPASKYVRLGSALTDVLALRFHVFSVSEFCNRYPKLYQAKKELHWKVKVDVLNFF